MKDTGPINLYSSREFREAFFRGEDATKLFTSPFADSFFVNTLQTLLQVVRLPIPPLREKNHIIIWVTAGELELNVASEVVRLCPNNLIVIPAHSVYAMHAVSAQATGMVCHFNTSLIPPKFIHLFSQQEFTFLYANHVPQLIDQSPRLAHIPALLDRLYAEYQAEGKANLDILMIYLLALLYEIKQSVDETASAQNADQRISSAFKRLLREYIRTHHLVHQYADILCVTPNYLNRVVQRTTGQSSIKWIINTLVLEARVLLYHSEMSVQEIAHELGFADQSYFSRLFKKNMGLSPNDYRKKHKMS
jgi:AraC family transcriptional regulator, transcriptional activator of pobA